MKKGPIDANDLAASVIAVPPLCRDESLTILEGENARLIQHLEGGGVKILLYGGNANFYHIAPSEYGSALDLVEQKTSDDVQVIPSAGPSYGLMMDQAAILKGRGFPAAMVLPTLFPATSAGVRRAIPNFVEKAELPAVLYIKDEDYITADDAVALVEEGAISFIKYAVVRDKPEVDPLLAELVERIDPSRIVSGIGEQPAAVHLRDFGVGGFTSGCVCVAPARSMEMLAALKAEDYETAGRISEAFRSLEDLRNAHGPIPVLHHAVALAGLADTGPHLPLLDSLDDEILTEIGRAAVETLAWNNRLV